MSRDTDETAGSSYLNNLPTTEQMGERCMFLNDRLWKQSELERATKFWLMRDEIKRALDFGITPDDLLKRIAEVENGDSDN